MQSTFYKKNSNSHNLNRRNFINTGIQALGVAALGGSVVPSLSAQSTAEITSTDLGYAWLLQGAGCNVTVIPGLTEDGVLLIDGGLSDQSDALLDAIREITGQDKVHTLINTHFHPEQTGSNERVGAQGGVIIAHENTRLCLQNALLSANYEGRYGPLADVGIPSQTFRSNGKMKFAGQEIIYGYLPAAHTNGDIFLYFPILDTLITGGPLTTGQWPMPDIRQGAWMGGLVNAYEILSDVVSADTVVIPAHGPVTNGTQVVRMRNMYSELHLDMADQLNLGMGWDDITNMGLLAAYEKDFGDPASFLETAFRSLQMAYVPD